MRGERGGRFTESDHAAAKVRPWSFHQIPASLFAYTRLTLFFYNQSATRLFGSKEISGADIVAVAGAVETSDVDKIISACVRDRYDEAMVVTDTVLKHGFPALQLITQLVESVVSDSRFTDEKKSDVALRCAEADKALVDGADESLQLAAVVSVTCVALAAR